MDEHAHISDKLHSIDALVSPSQAYSFPLWLSICAMSDRIDADTRSEESVRQTTAAGKLTRSCIDSIKEWLATRACFLQR